MESLWQQFMCLPTEDATLTNSKPAARSAFAIWLLSPQADVALLRTSTQLNIIGDPLCDDAELSPVIHMPPEIQLFRQIIQQLAVDKDARVAATARETCDLKLHAWAEAQHNLWHMFLRAGYEDWVFSCAKFLTLSELVRGMIRTNVTIAPDVLYLAAIRDVAAQSKRPADNYAYYVRVRISDVSSHPLLSPHSTELRTHGIPMYANMASQPPSSSAGGVPVECTNIAVHPLDFWRIVFSTPEDKLEPIFAPTPLPLVLGPDSPEHDRNPLMSNGVARRISLVRRYRARLGKAKPRTNGEHVAARLKEADACIVKLVSDLDHKVLTQKCYMCHSRFIQKHAAGYLHNPDTPIPEHALHATLCFPCAALNSRMSTPKVDLRGWGAVVTGCRHTVGYATSLQLLRMGATVLGTSRFPAAALFTYAQEYDYEMWAGNLTLMECDFRLREHVDILLSRMHSMTPRLRIFINNAFFTVDQTPAYFSKVARICRSMLIDAPFLSPPLPSPSTASLTPKFDLILSPLSSSFLEKATKGALVVPVGELDVTAVAERVAATTSLCSEARIVWTQHHNIEEEANRPTLWSSSLSDTTYDEIMTTTVVNQVTPTLLIQAATKLMAHHAGPTVAGKRARPPKSSSSGRPKTKPFDAPVAPVASTDSDGEGGEEESKVASPQAVPDKAHTPALTPTERFELVLSQYPKPVPSFSRMNVVVNVTSTEHLHTTPQHAVTGMQKAAMENLIEKVAFNRQPGLYVYNADPGFVTGVYGGPTKPLSSIDGGARVLHPLIQAAIGRGLGQNCILFKDYAVTKRLQGSTFGMARPK